MADKPKPTVKKDEKEDKGVTANAVRDLPDEAKTGALRRREAREQRLADEAEA